MSSKETFRRYLLFLGAIFVNSFSIAVITKALLGTSPISSVPYVLSLFAHLTMGQYTILMNLVFILLEMVLMKRNEIKEKKYELLIQVPITLCFGSFIDVSMNILYWLAPVHYLTQVFTLLVGCFLLALGIGLEVKANVAMVTGEYLVQVISKFIRKEFGFVKVCFDVTLVSIACILSVIFLGRLEGVREGTVIAALIVGPIVHFLNPYMNIFNGWLNVSPRPATGAEAADGAHAVPHPLVITITREYGSGGRQLGQMLAKQLGINSYDKELISMVASESNFSEKYITQNEQSMSSNYLLNIILQDYESPIDRSLSSADALFVSQSRVIRKIARKESCVIIGRCSDYILKDLPGSSLIRIFCYCDKASALKRCVEEYKLQAENPQAEIERINKARITHYQHYTGQKWGDPHQYDLTINTGSMDMQTACNLVSQLYRSKLSQHDAER